MGVDIGKTNILVHAAVMIGKKYNYGQTGKITLEKQVTDMRFKTLLVCQCVIWRVSNNISEEAVACIFRLEESTLKKEAEISSEMLVSFYRIHCVTSQKMVLFTICVV
jgi:hypothetical protein